MNHNKTYLDEDFSEQDLSGDTLSGRFINTDFTRANLQNAILNGTFVDCDFSGADLRGAKLFFKELSNAFRNAIMPDGNRHP
jgi:uncharacterized protein YjbI with pentapeptide repeats